MKFIYLQGLFATNMQTIAYAYVVLIFVATLPQSLCTIFGQNSSISDIAKVAQECFNAAEQGIPLSLYGLMSTKNVTASQQLVGQMCVAAALRHKLDTDSDVTEGLFYKSTLSNIVDTMNEIMENANFKQFYLNKTFGNEIDDLLLQSSRIAVYDAPITGPQNGNMRAIIYYFDTICSNADVGDCQQDQQVYCSKNDDGNISSILNSCWLQYQRVPLYQTNTTNNFVKSGFPLFGLLQQNTNNAQIMLAKQLAVDTTFANSDAEFITDRTSTQGINLKFNQFSGVATRSVLLRAKINSEERCDRDIITYSTSIENMTGGPFPFVVEQDRDGICVLGFNNNMLAGTPQSETLDNPNTTNVNQVGSTSLTGYCNINSTVVIRSAPVWDTTLQTIVSKFGSVASATTTVDSDICPTSTVAEDTIAQSGISEGRGICVQQYCSELMFSPGGGAIYMLTPSSVDANGQLIYGSNNSGIIWPRGQTDNPLRHKNLTDGIMCNTNTEKVKQLLTCLTECVHKGISIAGGNIDDQIGLCFASFLPSNPCHSLPYDGDPYAYQSTGITINAVIPTNQTGPGTEASQFVSNLQYTTPISNVLLAYGQQIGSMYDYRSCWNDASRLDISLGDEEYDSNDSYVSLVGNFINATDVTNTVSTVIYINECINNLLSDAISNPNAATFITAANTTGSSLFALITVLIAVVSKEYENKIFPTIDSKTSLQKKTKTILVNTIVGFIIVASTIVGVLPVITTLVQEIKLANKKWTTSYTFYDDVLPDQNALNYITFPIKTNAAIQCIVQVKPPNYYVIVAVMSTILSLWLIVVGAVLLLLIKQCAKK